MENRKKPDKKPQFSGLIIFLVIIAFNLISSSELNIYRETIIYACAGVALVVAVAVIADKKKKSGTSRRSTGTEVFTAAHTHDRLTVDVSKEDGLDHWKKQLDDFMKAGIIERSEYNVLLSKYAQRLRNNK